MNDTLLNSKKLTWIELTGSNGEDAYFIDLSYVYKVAKYQYDDGYERPKIKYVLNFAFKNNNNHEFAWESDNKKEIDELYKKAQKIIMSLYE